MKLTLRHTTDPKAVWSCTVITLVRYPVKLALPCTDQAAVAGMTLHAARDVSHEGNTVTQPSASADVPSLQSILFRCWMPCNLSRLRTLSVHHQMDDSFQYEPFQLKRAVLKTRLFRQKFRSTGASSLTTQPGRYVSVLSLSHNKFQYQFSDISFIPQGEIPSTRLIGAHSAWEMRSFESVPSGCVRSRQNATETVRLAT